MEANTSSELTSQSCDPPHSHPTPRLFEFLRDFRKKEF